MAGKKDKNKMTDKAFIKICQDNDISCFAYNEDWDGTVSHYEGTAKLILLLQHASVEQKYYDKRTDMYIDRMISSSVKADDAAKQDTSMKNYFG